MTVDRRNLIKSSALGILSGLSSSQALLASGFSYKGLKQLGSLQKPNELGLRLPAGVGSQILAVANQQVKLTANKQSAYRWHIYPDGGACFPIEGGGWIYTSNSETKDSGGAGALAFDRNGRLIDAYSILSGTRNNCAGGPTPWQTWLSCEEIDRGAVFECDIFGKKPAQKRPQLGFFKHEAVAIDTKHWIAYLTEDEYDGCLYRFEPRSRDSSKPMDFNEGTLKQASINGAGKVKWLTLTNSTPNRFQTATRHQNKAATVFKGGEGIWYHDGDIYFTSKGDNKVWLYDTVDSVVITLYDPITSNNPVLSGVDNIVVSNDGHILVAEDGGDMQIVVLGPHGDTYPLLQITDQDHSEITGPAISPNGKKLYFSSQRGGPPSSPLGITYQLTGDFGGNSQS